MASIRRANCMELRLVRVWHQPSGCISPFSFVLDSILAKARFHTDYRRIPYIPAEWLHTATSCGFSTENEMKQNLLLEYSEKLAVDIAKLCSGNRFDNNTVFQIKKSSSSVFANITEAQYPQSLADMHSKLEIARKECIETESWLKLLFTSGSIDEQTFKSYRNLCGRIRRMLTASCITIENKLKQGWKPCFFL